ncbi:MAG: thioesterase family protein [Limnospira sp. PMC 1291.21]|uniref:Thioesterase superfamily protein n=2 Tax=Limnospira TaxID=2596745 RepID=B5W271_LIMMA|nr:MULTISPECIES: thioesterase family protein [Limnospira]EKD11597.1 thioesterase superfamily protein [Arthrospira platensis C1]MDC0836722.1 thioesterase family protein [Limnoraphis robusta]MDY7054681.1 thioesterase family protein [Limnospira fusiformis LS22]QJB27396.1 acyl-CoA thioesterase [Limnospira fusiformis SAG 85.79]EDZ94318.1 thioesterase superfamily protein [Limnospira maxima CS-328]
MSRLEYPSSQDQPTKTSNWFEYLVEVFPHQTDYAGAVWHGTYVGWMEEARIGALRSVGVGYDQLVALGFELPVVELEIRYHQFVHMGDRIKVKNRIAGLTKVRIPWEFEIESLDGSQRYVSATTTLVVIDRQTGKIRRQWPPILNEAIAKLIDNG